MKDQSKETLEATRPALPANRAVAVCLATLFDDQSHNATESVSGDLTYEDLIGTLLSCQDALQVLVLLQERQAELESALTAALNFRDLALQIDEAERSKMILPQRGGISRMSTRGPSSQPASYRETQAAS